MKFSVQWSESQGKMRDENNDEIESTSLFDTFLQCCRSDRSAASSRKKMRREYCIMQQQHQHNPQIMLEEDVSNMMTDC